MKKRTHFSGASPTGKGYVVVLLSLVGFLAAVTLLLSLRVYFNHDEFEHIHSAWYVQNGAVPYRDFFQNHHPLLWYLTVPFLAGFGHTTALVEAMRLLNFLPLLGIAAMIYLVAKHATHSRESALLSVLLLLSLRWFVRVGIEFRPDIPQVLFSLVSIRFVLRYFARKDSRSILLAGAAASLSFLFLQKTLFLLAALALLFLFSLWKREITLRHILFFALAFLVPQIFFLIWLAASGALDEYLVSNWLGNLSRSSAVPFHRFWLKSLKENPVFWILVLASVGYIWKTRDRVSPALNIICFLGLSIPAFTMLVSYPWPQYFLLPFSLFTVPAGHLLVSLFRRFNLNPAYRTAVILPVALLPLFFILPDLKTAPVRAYQKKVINFVMEHTGPGDCVYDGNIQFNLFRKDLHYFWYQVGRKKRLDTYRQFARNRRLGRLIRPEHIDYDLCRLINEKNPKIVSAYEFPESGCRTTHRYTETKFPGIYLRGGTIP